LFAFYEFVFAIDLNSTDFFTSTPYSFLLTVSSYLQGSGDPNQIEPIGGSSEIRLQEFLATPIVIYNDAWLGNTVSDSDMGKQLALAIPSYRVLHPLSELMIVNYFPHHAVFVYGWWSHLIGLVSGCSRFCFPSSDTWNFSVS
jgi:hypothetical protein